MNETETTETPASAPVNLDEPKAETTEAKADAPAATKHTGKKKAKKAAVKAAPKAKAVKAKPAKKAAKVAKAKTAPKAKKAKSPKRAAGHKAQCNVHKDAWKLITQAAKEQKVRDADVVRDLLYKGLKFKEPAAA